MATQRPKTNVEAQQRIVAQMDEIRPLLRKALQAKDQQAINKYMAEMERLNRQMSATATVTVGGVNIPIGSIGSGLQSGLSGLLTAIPDIATAGYNYFLAPQGKQITPLGELGTKYLGIQNEPLSDEQAYAFRISQGAGSAAIPSSGAKGLLLGTGLGAGDVAVSQTTGLPEGIVSGVYAVGNLTRAGFKGVKDFKESRKFQKFLKDNVPVEEQNIFKEFMFRGQGSDSPIVASALQKLRTNPEYTELFAKFDQAASDLATKGMAATTRVSSKQEATEAVATRVQRELDGLREARSQAATRIFRQANGYGGNRPIINSDKTFKQIDDLINDFSKKKTPNADKAMAFLTDLKERMSDRQYYVKDKEIVEVIVPKKLTTEETQSVLSEFGRKATQSDSLVKDLAITDQQRISAAIFGSLKDDLRNSRLAAKTSDDKAATGLLLQAREQVKTASENYDNLIAQGLPAFLKDKSLSQISYEDLYSNYKGLNELQRAKLRSYVGTTDQEALNFLDRNIFQDFVKSAQAKNDAGILTTDLEKLSTKWQTLGDNEKAALVTALGTNASEFDQRMKDALVFSRKMRVTQPAAEAEKIISADLQRGVSATVGASTGYAPAKGVDVAMTTINELFKKQGITDEQLMRMLLTPEGANFLRQGSLTGASQKTLDALTNIPTALDSSAPAFSAISRLIAPTQQQVVTEQQNIIEQPQVTTNQFEMPPDLQQETQQPTQDQQFQMPPDLVQQPSANDLTIEDQAQILNFLGASPKPSSMSGRNPQLQVR